MNESCESLIAQPFVADCRSVQTCPIDQLRLMEGAGPGESVQVVAEKLALCSSCQQFARSPDIYMAAHTRKPLAWTKKAKNKVP